MADQVEEEDHLKEIRRFEKVEHANAFFGGQNDAGFLITQDPFHVRDENIQFQNTFLYSLLTLELLRAWQERALSKSFSLTTDLDHTIQKQRLQANVLLRVRIMIIIISMKHVFAGVGQKRQDKSRPKQFNARMLK